MSDTLKNSSQSTLEKTAVNNAQGQNQPHVYFFSYWLFRRRTTQTQKFYLRTVYFEYTQNRLAQIRQFNLARYNFRFSYC